jgi:hypothetical protein
MLVAVESFDQLEAPLPHQKQLVLIPAPVVLDAPVVESESQRFREPEGLAPLLSCPSCNNELQVDESRLEKPFRCPLCFRLLIARAVADTSSAHDLKRFVLQKVAPADAQPNKRGKENGPTSNSENNTSSVKSKPSRESGIWPTSPVASGRRADVVAQLALYAVLYLSLVALLIGVFSKNLILSGVGFTIASITFVMLLLRRLKALRRERNIKAQFQSLTGRRPTSTHRLLKGAVLSIALVLLGKVAFEIFLAIQALESPRDLYLTLIVTSFACLASIICFFLPYYRSRNSDKSEAKSRRPRTTNTPKAKAAFQETR